MSDDHDWVARLLAASGPATMPDDVADRLARALHAEAGAARPYSEVAASEAAAAASSVTDNQTVTPEVTAPETASEATAPAPAAAGPPLADPETAGADPAAAHPTAAHPTAADAAADPDAVGGTAAVPPTATTATTATTGEAAAATTGAAAAATEAQSTPAVPGPGTPAVVPPTASVETTGALPALRSVTTGAGPTAARPVDDGSAAAAVPAGETGPTDPAQQVGDTGDTADGTAATSRPLSVLRPNGSSRREIREEDQGERRRRSLTRWAQVAAGVLVLGGAAAVVGTQLGLDDATLEQADAGAASAAEAAAPPRSLLATGTQYSTSDADRAAFDQQVRDLVALAATDPGVEALSGAADASPEAAAPAAGAPAAESLAAQDPAADAAQDPAASDLSAGARSAAVSSPLADPQVLADCIDQVTAGTTTTAAAVDLAVVDGLESTLVVVPDAAGLTYQVYIVGAGCSDIDTRFDFLTVTP